MERTHENGRSGIFQKMYFSHTFPILPSRTKAKNLMGSNGFDAVFIVLSAVISVTGIIFDVCFLSEEGFEDLNMKDLKRLLRMGVSFFFEKIFYSSKRLSIPFNSSKHILIYFASW